MDFKQLDDDYVAALAMELAKLPKIELKLSNNRRVPGKVTLTGNAYRDKWIAKVNTTGGRFINVVLSPSASQGLTKILSLRHYSRTSTAISEAVDYYANSFSDDVACNGDDIDPDVISVTLGLSVDEVNAMRTLAEEGGMTHSELVGFALRLMQEQLNTSDHLKTSG